MNQSVCVCAECKTNSRTETTRIIAVTTVCDHFETVEIHFRFRIPHDICAGNCVLTSATSNRLFICFFQCANAHAFDCKHAGTWRKRSHIIFSVYACFICCVCVCECHRWNRNALICIARDVNWTMCQRSCSVCAREESICTVRHDEIVNDVPSNINKRMRSRIC